MATIWISDELKEFLNKERSKLISEHPELPHEKTSIGAVAEKLIMGEEALDKSRK